MIPYPRDSSRFFRISSTAAALATITPHTRRPLATAARPAALSPRTARALVGVGAGAARPAPAEPPPPAPPWPPLGPSGALLSGQTGAGAPSPTPRSAAQRPRRARVVPPRPGALRRAYLCEQSTRGGQQGSETAARETVGGGGGRAMKGASRARAARTPKTAGRGARGLHTHGARGRSRECPGQGRGGTWEEKKSARPER